MNRAPSIAAVVGVVGAVGLVQVRAISLDPPRWMGIVIVLTLLAAVAAVRRASRHTVPEDVKRPLRSRPPKRPYAITEKDLQITTLPGGSIRHDAHLRWTTELRNRSRAALGVIELQLIGDVPVSGADLVVVGRTVERTLRLAATIDHRDGRAPLVRLSVPSPGLAPNETMTIEFEYVWPAIAHRADNLWFVDLRNNANGSIAGVRLSVPADEPQVVEAFVYRSRLGGEREHALGHLIPAIEDDRAIVVFEHAKRRGDLLVALRTRALTPAATDGDVLVAVEPLA
jgi:hypothetical protein